MLIHTQPRVIAKDDFLHAYARLATVAANAGERLWPLKPKLHVLWMHLKL